MNRNLNFLTRRDKVAIAIGVVLTAITLVAGCSSMDKGTVGQNFWNKRATEILKDEQKEDADT